MQRQTWIWLAVFWVGAYLLSSLNINKDNRYVVPYLPVVAVVLAYGLTCWPQRWRYVPWGGMATACLLMGLNLFAPDGAAINGLTNTLSPVARHPVYWGPDWPHPQVIAEIQRTEPYLQTTLGVLPSTATVNQHNFNFYGALADFQVYGRQVGTRREQVAEDLRSLSWFLTKSGFQGSIQSAKSAAQATLVQAIQNNPDFEVKTWPLPDGDDLQLYHRRHAPIQVTPLPNPRLERVELKEVQVVSQAPPGQPLAVTYTWTGNWEQLQSGLVLLTWERVQSPTAPQEAAPAQWFHDHALGLGRLYHQPAIADQSFQVVEQTATLPPRDLTPGTYRLQATYLNRQTGSRSPISTPEVQVMIDPSALPQPAPELDYVTQLRTLAATLPQGITAFDALFAKVGQINQYDPTQDYTLQTQQSLTERLRQEPKNLEFAYGLTLASLLQRQVQPTIAALQRVIDLDAQNPWPHAYLAFVYLYDLSPRAAQIALQPGLVLLPQQPELRAMKGIADLMQGNLWGAWQEAQGFLATHPATSKIETEYQSSLLVMP
ncbi:tetratricopeptide repeat protein [Neosynechococcus sphagnicola]|uniref:tetratricopeptide repeat protein n=1 Tax=Neosynechococcus sphagnicola TaxID=1501145 RepID=UPI000907D024|nr:hypothetical protein [Neosynechococcus sphagnicola]